MLSVAVLAGTFAAQVSAAQDQRKEIDAEIDARQKANASYRDIVEFLEGRVASDDARTNAALRVHIDRKILSFCATPGWTRLGRWDKEWSDGRVPAVCEREISAADCPPGDKIEFLCDYYNYDGSFESAYRVGEPLTVGADGLEITYKTVTDADFSVTWRLTDIYGNQFWLPAWRQ